MSASEEEWVEGVLGRCGRLRSPLARDRQRAMLRQQVLGESGMNLLVLNESFGRLQELTVDVQYLDRMPWIFLNDRTIFSHVSRL